LFESERGEEGFGGHVHRIWGLRDAFVLLIYGWFSRVSRDG
jgi:hypothetical protein